MPELFKIIQKRKAELKLNNAQIAGQMGVSERMIEYYEKGEKNPAYKNLVKLSKILKFDLTELSEPKVQKGHEASPKYDSIVKEESPSYGAANRSEEAILNLTQSNKILAEAQLKIADSNQELTFMVKQAFIEGKPQERFSNQGELIERLASLIGLIGAGKRFSSPAEAVRTIDNILYGGQQDKPQKGRKTVLSSANKS